MGVESGSCSEVTFLRDDGGWWWQGEQEDRSQRVRTSFLSLLRVGWMDEWGLDARWMWLQSFRPLRPPFRLVSVLLLLLRSHSTLVLEHKDSTLHKAITLKCAGPDPPPDEIAHSQSHGTRKEKCTGEGGMGRGGWDLWSGTKVVHPSTAANTASGHTTSTLQVRENTLSFQLYVRQAACVQICNQSLRFKGGVEGISI